MNSDDEKRSNEVTAEVVDAVKAAVGKEKVGAGYAGNEAGITVKPATTGDVAKIAAIAADNNISVASSNCPETSIEGRRFEGGIFVDLSGMDKICEVDRESMSVKVQPGCGWKELLCAVAKEGFIIGSYPFNVESAVGSWAVSGEAGIGSYKYGTGKDNILNFKVVTAEGKVLETGYDRIGHYMSGYNLTDYFAASQGAEGIVTSVTFKMFPAGVFKSAAYTFESVSAMYAPLEKVVQHPSIKPYDIAWCGLGRTLFFTFQGEEEFVDFEMAEIAAVMADCGGVATDIDEAADICAKRQEEEDGASKIIVPLKAWNAISEEFGDDTFGSVLDRSTAAFMSTSVDKSSFTAAAERNGGREYRNTVKWKVSCVPKGGDVGSLSRTVTPKTISALEDIVGKKNVNVNEVDRLLYSHDMAPLPKEAGIAFKNIPDVVVRPSKVEEISAIMALAYKEGIPVTPRGNASWGLAGCMPTNGGILLDMSSCMNKVLEIDTESMTVTAGAGITWKALLEACMRKGYIVGSYPSSFPSGTVGAWLATNGMGVGSYKYGSARDNVMSMKVVLCDGTVLDTGYDKVGSYRTRYNLNQMFSGSEGTLCIFGTVTFRMYPMGEIRPLAYEYPALKDMHDSMMAITHNASVRPLHVAWSDSNHFANQRKAGIHAPDVQNLLLVTIQGDSKFLDFEEQKLDEMMASLGGKKIDNAIAAHEWDERCYEFRARSVGVGEIPAEVITPANVWGDFIDECYAGFKDMKMEAGGVIGVLVDRNTTLHMPYYFKDDESLLGMTAFGFNFYLGDKAAGYGGRTTGFGVFFAWNLDNVHDIETVRYMRMLKTRMDPRDVVNPGHVVCGMTRFGINMSKQLMGLGSNVMQIAKKMLPANTTFEDNIKRFRYNTLEHRKDADRMHTLGDGTQ